MTIRDEVVHLATQIYQNRGESLPPGITEADIEDFSHRTELLVPPEFGDWLKFTNGPCLGPGGIYGIRPLRKHFDIEGVYEFLPVFKENKWLPLGTDGCGDYYVLALESEPDSLRPIYFIDPYQTGGYGVPTYVVASEFWLFLRFLLRSELGDSSWPFDTISVLAHDPDIAQVKGARMPWKA